MSDINVFVSGSFFSMQALAIRFLEEAARLGRLHVILWADEPEAAVPSGSMKFTVQERQYLLENIRYVSTVTIAEKGEGWLNLPLQNEVWPDIWAEHEKDDLGIRRAFCETHGIQYRQNELLLHRFPSKGNRLWFARL